MKISRYIYPAAFGAVLLGSCADDLQKNIVVDKPESVIEDERYKDLNALKEYISGDMKLSASVSADDMLEGGLTAAVAVNNFNELAAEASFAHGAVVKDDGTPDFTKIQSLANTAEKYGMTVFGGPLAASFNQNADYLNSVIAEKKIVTVIDVPDVPAGPQVVPSDNGLVSKSPGSWYQYFVADGIPTVEGKTYSIIVEIKGKDGEGSFNANMGWGWGEGESTSTQISFTKDWTTQTFDFAGPVGKESCNCVFQPGGLATTFYVRSVKFVEKGSTDVIYENDFTQFTSFTFYVMGYEPEFNYEEIEGAAPAPSVGTPDQNITEERRCYIVHTGDKVSEAWDSQFWFMTTDGYPEGASYEFSALVRADHNAKASTQIHNEPGGYVHWAALGDINFTQEWTKVTATGTLDKAGKSIALNLNEDATANNYYFDNISLKINGTEALVNGDAEGTETSGFFVKEKQGDIHEAAIAGDPCVIVHAGDKVAEAWDTQFWLVTDGYSEGASYEFSAMVKANHAAKATTQIHNEPGGYVHWAAIGDVNFTDEWTKVTATGTLDKAGKTIAFNLNEDATANNYYFKNISLKINGSEAIVNGDLSGTDMHSFVRKEKQGDIVEVPLAYVIDYVIPGVEGANTITEYVRANMQEVLSSEMVKFISGMMDASNGVITAWDVVADPISDGSVVTADNFYGLQHGDSPNSVKTYANTFYWQDYMGDTIVSKKPDARKLGDTVYVRTAVDAARKYFAGDKSQLKLFVSEYGLEKDTKKVASLLHWIDVWENDTIKIDGISVQLHLSASDDVEKVKSALSALAQSGKLIRISALDVSGADDDDVAKMYKEVVKAYKSSVPAAQQYGINLTGVQSGSDYTSLWTDEYKRNASYRSFVEGLSGN